MRLTKNNENRNPLGIIRGYSSKQSAALRGQPNFRKLLLEYFETKIYEDEAF